MNHHIQNECPKTQIKCPVLWCDSLILREKCKMHLESNIQKHTELQNNYINKLKETISELTKEQQKRDKLIQKQQNQISRIENRLYILQKEVHSLGRNIEKM